MRFRWLAAISVSIALVVGSPSIAMAGTLANETRDLRTDVSQTIGSYVTKYGDRVTPTQKATLTSLARDADKELLKVQRAVSRAENIPSSQRSKKLIAINAALRTHAAAESRAEASLASARSILEPKLSLFEALNALSDYERLMDSYDNLGTALKAQREAIR